MSKATYPLKLPPSIKKAAQRLAKEDGVSLNQWIAVREKVGWWRLIQRHTIFLGQPLGRLLDGRGKLQRIGSFCSWV